MKINVHIERLVLDGIAVENSARLRGAVETELASHLAQYGLAHAFRQGGAHSFLNAGEIAWDGSKSEAQLGKRIAGAVYGGIGEKK
jgi:hypothetical protein